MSDIRDFGGWRVDFRQGSLRRRYRPWEAVQRPDSRLIQVLSVLVNRGGETVGTEELLRAAWPERVVGRDSVTTAIYQLRQLLGDDADKPKYIASVPRRGYRFIARVTNASPSGTWQAACATGVLLALVLIGWVTYSAQDTTRYVYVTPMQNYAESPVQEPLFSAIQTTFLSELIQTAPGRVRLDDGDDIALRLESMMVACDLGPTLVMRLLDTETNTYVWSNTYNLEEVMASQERPTLVYRAASDVGAAIY